MTSGTAVLTSSLHRRAAPKQYSSSAWQRWSDGIVPQHDQAPCQSQMPGRTQSGRSLAALLGNSTWLQRQPKPRSDWRPLVPEAIACASMASSIRKCMHCLPGHVRLAKGKPCISGGPQAQCCPEGDVRLRRRVPRLRCALHQLRRHLPVLRHALACAGCNADIWTPCATLEPRPHHNPTKPHTHGRSAGCASLQQSAARHCNPDPLLPRCMHSFQQAPAARLRFFSPSSYAFASSRTAGGCDSVACTYSIVRALLCASGCSSAC